MGAFTETVGRAFEDPQTAPALDTYTEVARDLPDANRLVRTFFVFAALILLIGMLLFGTWVTQRTADAVLQHSAHSSAMFMDSAIEPLVQELKQNPKLSESSLRAIDDLLAHRAISEKLTGIVIWRRDGVIAYAKDRSLIGRAEPVGGGLAAAMRGEVEIEQLGSAGEAVADHLANSRGAYRIYSPMHELGTSDVIAVAGYVEPPQQLEPLLAQGRRETWVVVGLFTLLIFGLTFNLIHHASEMIKEQNHDLRDRYTAQVRLNLQNEMLRQELQQAHLEGLSINENFLRRISADLHDGPAQFLALALLRLDDINTRGSDERRDADPQRNSKALETVRCATQNALSEIRSISTGLALPALQNRSPEEIIGAAVNAFISTTQTVVTCDIGKLPEKLSPPLTVCLFRFVQEGLSNGFRHAGGKGQAVRAAVTDAGLVVEVSDQGPGIADFGALVGSQRLGLIGLRHRIEILGDRSIFAQRGARARPSCSLCPLPHGIPSHVRTDFSCCRG